MISVDGLAVEFGGTTLFSDISFVINEKDRIALMGQVPCSKFWQEYASLPVAEYLPLKSASLLICPST